jgi:hypothetical protein
MLAQEPANSGDVESIVNRVLTRLQHANSVVPRGGEGCLGVLWRAVEGMSL